MFSENILPLSFKLFFNVDTKLLGNEKRDDLK